MEQHGAGSRNPEGRGQRFDKASGFAPRPAADRSDSHRSPNAGARADAGGRGPAAARGSEGRGRYAEKPSGFAPHAAPDRTAGSRGAHAGARSAEGRRRSTETPSGSAPRPAFNARPAPARDTAPERLPLTLAARPAESRAAPSRARAAQPSTAETPRGTVWLYGIHAVEAALGNPQRRLRRLILTEEAEAALLARRPQPWPLAPERSDRARLDQLLGRDTVHQGAALLADPLASPLLTALVERPGVVLVLDQVTDPRNIGAVLRSAAAFGAAGLITQDRNAPEETGALAKAASGALEQVPLLRAVNLARTLVALKAAGFWTVGLDAGGAPLSGPALSERRVALVLGAEGAGLRRLVRETCDEVAGLAMPGSMESLNVSAAATVALYEMARRS